jgi:AmiR/NasT family two-component response regulator
VAPSDDEWSPQTAVDVVSHDDTDDPSGARAVEALIAQAEAILMARRQCARAQAYLLLSKAAQRNGLKVSELADLIVADEKLR